MARIRSRDTEPERLVRSLLHLLGYRFRIHRADLPGSPDIVLPRRHTVVFVHGCFWHQHSCKAGRIPRSRIEYWGQKLARNQARDRRNVGKLRRGGWRVITVWECELKDPEKLERRLLRLLG